MSHYDDDLDDEFEDEDDDLAYFSAMSPDVVRLTHYGLDLPTQESETMVGTLKASPGVTQAQFDSAMATLNSQLGDLADRIAERIGDGLARHKASQPKPLKLAGDVGVAAFNRDEAGEIVDVLEYIGEYGDAAQSFAAAGIDLKSYVESRIRDEVGTPMPGCPDLAISDSMRSGLAKQSAMYASKYPIRRPGLL